MSWVETYKPVQSELAYCLNYLKVKTSIFTGTRPVTTKQHQCLISHEQLLVYKNLPGF